MKTTIHQLDRFSEVYIDVSDRINARCIDAIVDEWPSRDMTNTEIQLPMLVRDILPFGAIMQWPILPDRRSYLSEEYPEGASYRWAKHIINPADINITAPLGRIGAMMNRNINREDVPTTGEVQEALVSFIVDMVNAKFAKVNLKPRVMVSFGPPMFRTQQGIGSSVETCTLDWYVALFSGMIPSRIPTAYSLSSEGPLFR